LRSEPNPIHQQQDDTTSGRQRGSGIIIITNQSMRCSFFLWSSIFHSLVAVEAFAALSHRSFAPARSSLARSSMVAATTTNGILNTRGGVARTTGGGSALQSSTSSTTALELSGGGGGAATATPEGGTATILNEVFNLVKSIVGAGVLSVSNTNKQGPNNGIIIACCTFDIHTID
jgi:hypothetical protein